MRLISHSESETRQFASDLAKRLHGGQILALDGDLGSGKTTFVKGLAEGFAIRETIRSPTFVLMKIFEIKRLSDQAIKRLRIKYLVHIDAYRLKDELELEEMGAMDFIGQPNTLTVIEWPERITGLLKKFKKVKKIHFNYGEKENERVIKLQRAA